MNDSNVDATARAAITERNARESPLLRLPPELRNRIWHYVIDRNVCNYASVKDGNSGDWTVALKNLQPRRRAILRVCRQIYYETVDLPIAFTFTFERLSDLNYGIENLPIRLRSAVDEMHVVAALTEFPDRLFIWRNSLEGSVPFVDFLPNVDRVNIHYIVPHVIPQGTDPAYPEQAKQKVVKWMHKDKQGKLEMVVSESIEPLSDVPSGPPQS